MHEIETTKKKIYSPRKKKQCSYICEMCTVLTFCIKPFRSEGGGHVLVDSNKMKKKKLACLL